jgi:hypothetical protein
LFVDTDHATPSFVMVTILVLVDEPINA